MISLFRKMNKTGLKLVQTLILVLSGLSDFKTRFKYLNNGKFGQDLNNGILKTILKIEKSFWEA